MERSADTYRPLAETMRSLPERDAMPGVIGEIGGDILVQLLELGAFDDEKHLRLRNRIRFQMYAKSEDRKFYVFMVAIDELMPDLSTRGLGAIEPACARFADLIDELADKRAGQPLAGDGGDRLV